MALPFSSPVMWAADQVTNSWRRVLWSVAMRVSIHVRWWMARSYGRLLQTLRVCEMWLESFGPGSNGWEPFGFVGVFNESFGPFGPGGVAALDPRLMAGNPSGSRDSVGGCDILEGCSQLGRGMIINHVGDPGGVAEVLKRPAS